MTWRRWERWHVIEVEGQDPDITLAGRHFTRWGAQFAADMSYSPNVLATIAYWNSLWPDERILSFRQEITRAAS